MKKIFFILFISLLNSNIFGFSIIDRLNMPPNEKYFKKLSIQLNRLDKFIEKKDENNKKEVKTFSVEKNFKLSGILKINDKFYAIINGESYEKGATVNNFKIESIKIGKVVLKNKTKKERIILKIEN